MKVQDWLDFLGDHDPEAELILMFEGVPKSRWSMQVFEDMTQGEPKPLVFFLTPDPLPTEQLA